jgi:hypothetical protein
MGLLSYIKGLFWPYQEEIKRELQRIERRHIWQVLLIMARRRQSDPEDMPSLLSIYHDLVCQGRRIPADVLIGTMQVVVDRGYVQRIDGGNMELPPNEGYYFLTDNGVNYLVHS